MSEGAVYVQTNEAENAVVAFRRAADGTLTELGRYTTGGAGGAAPHLPSQGSVTLTGDGRHLLVTNAASADVTLFSVAEDGGLEAAGSAPAGPAPRSVTEHDGLVYVLSTGTPALIGFRLTEGGLAPVAGDPSASAAGRRPGAGRLHARWLGRHRDRAGDRLDRGPPRRRARCAGAGGGLRLVRPDAVRFRIHQ